MTNNIFDEYVQYHDNALKSYGPKTCVFLHLVDSEKCKFPEFSSFSSDWEAPTLMKPCGNQWIWECPLARKWSNPTGTHWHTLPKHYKPLWKSRILVSPPEPRGNWKSTKPLWNLVKIKDPESARWQENEGTQQERNGTHSRTLIKP